MKILVLGKFYPPVRGGIETHLQDLARAIGSTHDVTVLVHHEGRETIEERVDGVRLIRAGTLLRPLNQPISPAMLWLVRTLHPDVVHLHFPNAWSSLALLATGGRQPLIISHHADILGREPARSLVVLGYRQLARRARVVVVSRRNNHRCSAHLQALPLREVREIPFCAEPSPFAAEPGFVDEANALRRSHFGDKRVAIFVGRLVAYKGADQMIAALQPTPLLRLVVVGGGPLDGALRAQARALGVDDRIFFTGACDERTKQLWLAASDFLILPSTTIAEAFGIVQIEAMLWSKPVLTTNLPSGVPEVGEPNETSLVVPPSDVVALAEAMRRLTNDVDLCGRLGAAGFERARKLFSFERFTRNCLELYSDAVRRPG